MGGSLMLHRTGHIAAMAIACLLVGLAPRSAQAFTGDCGAQPLSQPFAAWGDDGNYTPVDDGGFEAGAAGWRLDDASVVEDARDRRQDGEGDRVLELADHAKAVSPPICIGLGHPTMRLLARNVGSPLGVLTVEALAPTALGITLPVPIGLAASWDSAWRPTPRLLTIVNLLTLLPPGTSEVAFRFRAIGINSAWRIDDVYVDPYGKR